MEYIQPPYGHRDTVLTAPRERHDLVDPLVETWDSFEGWPSTNAKKKGTLESGWFGPSKVGAAHAWLRHDPANRMIEGVQLWPWGHKQVLWERVDKTKPIGFKRGKAHTPGKRGLSFYVATQQNSELQPPAGGCLCNLGGNGRGDIVWEPN